MDTGGVEVKTKFPTARIKRIMQADEDVGKVAQVTPVVVAKALELFMIRLITSSANVAKSRGSKKVMSQHMKAAVMQDDQFDNLRDIMAKVPDAPTSKNGAKDDDDDEEGAAPKPKGRGKGKKRRDSDDF
ncbi:histone-fold-containing protein [Delphinella strobiligena]|nr:histone-fold-containing protein [Delphinella strobiligena]